MRIWAVLSHINIWTLHEANGNNYCTTNNPVIHVCTKSTGNNQDNVMKGVYVNTGLAPRASHNVCRCTIIPATMKTLSLNIRGNSKMPTVEFMIEINNMTLNDLPFFSTVEINGETELVYSSTIDFKGGLCLSIASSSSNGTFSMTCGSTQKKVVTSTEETTTSSGHITETMSEPTVSQTQTKPSHDANPNSKTTINLIAVVTGSIVGVAVIVVVIIALLVCCKRKRKSDFTQATALQQTGNVNDGTNGGQPNSAYTNCELQMHTSGNGSHYEELDITHIDSSSNNNYSNLFL